ncbi:preprotein translocase subunit YajC [Arthrobacter echini]|uniref:Preprotein translocase subunit YajC n=2 Tax=Arthrobacter echini TaxID=1529066 RepID=A0A4S5E7H4_9MICC|nr:preprotein translocase subunit YajC [Arthrobacter echini]
MFRRQRKTQKQVRQMRTELEPGTEVMTQFGLFGTIVSIDQENNKAVLELSPGNHATVHTQALTRVVQQDAAVSDDAAAGEPDRPDLERFDGMSVPDDASSLDGVDRIDGPATGDGTDRPAASGSTAAGAGSTDVGSETPEQTVERLDRERARREERDARGHGGPANGSDN